MRTVYDAEESGMDSVEGSFRPEDAGGFISVGAIRLRKAGGGGMP